MEHPASEMLLSQIFTQNCPWYFYTSLSIIFTLILKTSVSLLHYNWKRPVEKKKKLWIGRVFFLEFFFAGKMLPLSFPEPNLTNETQKYSVACWFSKRVHCRWEVLHYTYRNYRYAREF